MRKLTKTELFEKAPVPRALATLAVPTIISQLINLIYNIVDAFFIGRTGNSYMMAATTLVLTLTMMNVAFSNLFGIGGGSLIARLMGEHKEDEAKNVSAFSCFGGLAIGFGYAAFVGALLHPILWLLGASDDTIGFASSYAFYVIVLGSLPTVLSLTLAHLLRNTGHAAQASLGLSLGGVLNMALDPLFMFVLLPPGQEVVGAALATLISNVAACLFLLTVFLRATRTAPLSFRFRAARKIRKEHVKSLFSVGCSSAILTGLFDLANIFLNKISSAHNDFVLAAMGIVMKIERIPNAVNIGLCQGMMPIVAYNYAADNRERMRKTVRTARWTGLAVSAISVLLLEIFAAPVTKLFLSTGANDPSEALKTLGYAALFLRIRCLAAPVQFLNYHSSFCMQALGRGRETMLHAFVRELVFYIPLMFLLDRLFAEAGLAAALPAGEALGALFALFLLRRVLRAEKKPAR